ncbi:hypothetical protein ABZP36_008470 [Zizania latifolia]
MAAHDLDDELPPESPLNPNPRFPRHRHFSEPQESADLSPFTGEPRPIGELPCTPTRNPRAHQGGQTTPPAYRRLWWSGIGRRERRRVQELRRASQRDVKRSGGDASVNRADTVQRQGLYPVPPGASPFLGLECSGTIVTLRANVPSLWAVGDQVCALLSGGGYVEKVMVPAGQLLPVPERVSLTDATGLTVVACTIWSTVFMTSHLSPGEPFLIHGGSSGISTFAIQIAKHLGIKVFVTAGIEEKLAACKGLGADLRINYKTEDFVACVKEETNGKGVDVILDNIGGLYLQCNLNSLGLDGRLFIIGFQGGAMTEVSLQPICLLDD